MMDDKYCTQYLCTVGANLKF